MPCSGAGGDVASTFVQLKMVNVTWRGLAFVPDYQRMAVRGDKPEKGSDYLQSRPATILPFEQAGAPTGGSYPLLTKKSATPHARACWNDPKPHSPAYCYTYCNRAA